MKTLGLVHPQILSTFVGEMMELVDPTSQHGCVKFPWAIRILKWTNRQNEFEYLVHCFEVRVRYVLGSPVWGMHRWERIGSRSHSASSETCWNHLHGQEVHHESVEVGLFSLNHFHLFCRLNHGGMNSQTSVLLLEGRTQLPPPAPTLQGSPGWLKAYFLDVRLDDAATYRRSGCLQGIGLRIWDRCLTKTAAFSGKTRTKTTWNNL